ncbi:ATP-binding protein [Streptomyces dysideae]|uniref:Histidine kinase/HSP90-like ATPase domain-containing protein n=1 Tax=Streptomyces dysideae TaxID=909626 RepID=A0A101UPN8_9ACTN|nr:histidine kinase [Streptomyces dysideae]KUO14523.1 hypothetical protein AQJ91_46360 [Streptomyces dysideae]
MLAAGAVGYLVKGAPAQEVVEAVTRAARGQFSMPAELAEACLRPLRRDAARPVRPGTRPGTVGEGTNRDRQVLLGRLIHAQEEERRRIAADIHDDPIQVITAACLRLQQLRGRLTDARDIQVMGRLYGTLGLSLSRLRRLVFDLRPAGLEHGSLATALQAFLDRMRAECGTPYRFEDRLRFALPVETMVLVYHTAQEALMNVRKHARAKMVRVQLLGVDDGCLMRVVDDGVGYDLLEADSCPGHLGLTLIHERAQMAGGWSRVESEPGAGTTVEFGVPLAGAPAASTGSGTEGGGVGMPKAAGP